jgi:hypothetical protein
MLNKYDTIFCVNSGMNKNFLFSISAIVLAGLGVYMIYLGYNKHLLPPALTGIGFIIIGIVFWSLRK